jgi:hypothetical protein
MARMRWADMQCICRLQCTCSAHAGVVRRVDMGGYVDAARHVGGYIYNGEGFRVGRAHVMPT